MKRLTWHIKQFFWRIKNTWSWTKFAWNIRWYEYTDIYGIIKFSLQKTIEHFESSQVQHTDTQRDVEYMRLCIKLIDRLQTDYYDERMEEELQKRWGNYRDAVKVKREFKDDDILVLFEIKRELEVTEADSKRYNKDFKKTLNYWRGKQQKAKRLLFNILNNRIEHWWL